MDGFGFSHSSDQDFCEQRFIEMVDECSSYEELRVRCDLESIECILAEDEFKNFKRNMIFF